MAIWILKNQYYAQIEILLRRICPDPALDIDFAGRVDYQESRRTVSSVGCDMIALIQSIPGTVVIRGETSNWSGITGGKPLKTYGGFAIADIYPGTKTVEIVLDITKCDGHGLYTIGVDKRLITMPLDVGLYHELVHSLLFLLGAHDERAPEADAISGENLYRRSLGLPPRGYSEGGCIGEFSFTDPAASAVPAVCVPLLYSIGHMFGASHTALLGALLPEQRSYKVTVANQSSTLFSEIILFYKQFNQNGTTWVRWTSVAPGAVVEYVCGLTKDFESYVIGFFDNGQLVAKIPKSGNLYPDASDGAIDSDVHVIQDA